MTDLGLQHLPTSPPCTCSRTAARRGARRLDGAVPGRDPLLYDGAADRVIESVGQRPATRTSACDGVPPRAKAYAPLSGA